MSEIVNADVLNARLSTDKMPSSTGVQILQRVINDIDASREALDSALTPEVELAELFGVHESTVRRHISMLQPEDRQYYRKNVKREDGRRLSQNDFEVVAAVRVELVGLAAGDDISISRNDELMARFSLTEGALASRLQDAKNGLSSAEQKQRRKALRSRVGRENALNPETESLAAKLVAEVKRQIAEHQVGERERLDSGPELIERFGVNQGFLQKHLTSKAKGQLTPEEKKYRRSVLSRQTTLATIAEHGIPEGLNNRSVEERREAFFKGQAARVQTFEENGGHPFTKLSTTERQDNADKAWKTKKERYSPEELRKGRDKALTTLRKRRNIVHEGNRFDSLQEAACAVMLERFIPDFKVRPGENYQVTLNGAQFDFLVNGSVVEWHPILLFRSNGGFGAFSSAALYEKYRTRVDSFEDKQEKRAYIERVRGVLAARYKMHRQDILDEASETAALPLRHCTAPAELYQKVIVSFAENVPSERVFVRDFNKTLRELSKAHKLRKAKNSTAKK